MYIMRGLKRKGVSRFEKTKSGAAYGKAKGVFGKAYSRKQKLYLKHRFKHHFYLGFRGGSKAAFR